MTSELNEGSTIWKREHKDGDVIKFDFPLVDEENVI